MAKGKARFVTNRSANTGTTIDKDPDPRISESTLSRISEKLGVPLSQVSNVARSMKAVAEEAAAVDRIVDEYKGDKTALIQILLEIQRENHWLPKDILEKVCERLNIPLSRAYRIATFYKAFSLVPQGRHRVSICQGTACHVRGAPRLLDKVTDVLGVPAGETSSDRKFTVETVNCLGCCALGPVMVIDGEYHSNPSTKDIQDIVASCD